MCMYMDRFYPYRGASFVSPSVVGEYFAMSIIVIHLLRR